MNLNVYTDKAYKKVFESKVAKVCQYNDMRIDVVENGAFIVNVETSAYGVFDANGKFVDSSLQYRGKNTQFIPSYLPVDEYMDCDAVFLGNAYHHFGHFIIEHLNRAWGIEKIHRDNIKYVFVDNKNIGAKSWLFDFTDMLGIVRDDVIILNKSMRFKNVYIPTQSLNNSGNMWAPEFKDAFDVMRENVAANQVYERVYVSRAKLPDNMRTYNEEKIQKVFERNGFHVIYPETLPLHQQVAIIGNCKCLAGCAGTALHMGLFMKTGGRIIQLNRSSDCNDSGALQWRMCMMKGLDFDIVSASVEEFKSKHGGTHAPQIIAVTKYLKQFFDDNGFVYVADDLIVDNVALADYRKNLKDFKKNNGGQVVFKIKRLLIKVIACMVPGRVNRGRVRKYLKEHL